MINLNNISHLSIGCAGFGNEYQKMNLPMIKKIINTAIDHNVNYFDTAPFYGSGLSEKNLGRCLNDILRNKIFISTKVGRISENKFDFSYNGVIRSLHESLKRLQLDKIDLVQCHDIEFCESSDIILNETLPALEKLKQEGKIRYIGITSLYPNVLDYIIEHSKVKIDTVLVYCSYNLFNNTLNKYCSKWKEKGITIIQGGVTAMGLLTDDGPRDWHPASNEIKLICGKAIDYCNFTKLNITEQAFHFVNKNKDIDSILVGITSITQLYDYIYWIKDTKEIDKELLNILLPIKNKIWSENGVNSKFIQ